jgi:O-antigen/teichoic acid export membrane protein
MVRGSLMPKKIMFYTFFYLSALIFMRVCGVLSKILLARSITPYEYGLITLLIIALPGTFQIITNFCFFDILGHSVEGKKYFSFSLIYGTVTTLIIALIFLVYHEVFFQFLNIPTYSWEFFYSVLFGVLLSVTLGAIITGILRGERSHFLAASFSAGPSILRLVFVIGIVYVFKITNFYLILLIFALPPLVALIAVLIYKRKAIFRSFQLVSIPEREILLFGFAFFIVNSYISLIQNISSLVISHELGIVWQGYFDVSMSLVAIISFFFGAIYLISAPETTTHSNRSEISQNNNGFADIGRFLFSMCLLYVILIYFYSHQIIRVLFTSSYSPAGDYLIIAAIGYTVFFIQQYCAYLSISIEKEGISRITMLTIAMIAVSPLFIYIMTLKFKFIGVYLAMTGMIVVYTIITLILIKDKTPFKQLFFRSERLILSVAGTFLILYFLQFSLIFGLIVSTVSFFTFIFLTGYIDKSMLTDFVLAVKEKITIKDQP